MAKLYKTLQEDINMKNEKALQAFMENMSDAKTLFEKLQAHINDHMGINPDDINWGHVGDIGYIVEKLTALFDRESK